MVQVPAETRRFLFLQGPHGPFFDDLAGVLREAGAETWRAGFTQGDAAFWRHRAGYIPHPGPAEDWPGHCAAILDGRAITDLVLYGDSRPIHAAAIAAGRARGVALHVFEEGYLRPHWVTYERGGANGNSRLMAMEVADMRRALAAADPDLPEAPARWGDLAQHMAWGALYHFHVMARNGAYPGYRPHRGIAVGEEFRLNLARLLAMPWHRAERALAARRLAGSGRPYHLVLLQLDHDASLRAHSDVPDMATFARFCLAAFRDGAPRHHRLAFKAHPLEDGRGRIREAITAGAAALGLSDRVIYLPGGKLAPVLSEARSVVTVNSTAAHQALWRGIPVRAFGRAVYAKPEFVSDLHLADFFAGANPPDTRAYRDFRRYLLETSQVPGGFYSARGRRRLLRAVADRMFDPLDPYDRLAARSASRVQQGGPDARAGLGAVPVLCHDSAATTAKTRGKRPREQVSGV